VDAVPVPVSGTSPYENAVTRRLTPLTSESQAARVTDATVEFFERHPAPGVPASTSAHRATGDGHCA
jgi:hypothetical protein